MKNKLASLSLGENFLFKAFESSCTDYPYIWDIVKGEYTVSNKMTADFGLPDVSPWDFQEVWLSLIHPEDGPRVIEGVQKLLEGSSTRLYMEYRVKTDADEYVWVTSKGLLQRSPDDKIPQILAGTIHRLEGGGAKHQRSSTFTDVETKPLGSGELLLRECIEKQFKGMEVVYQPICNARTLRVEGVKASLQFIANGREVPREELLSALISSEQIVAVGIWGIEQAISACVEWIAGKPDIVVAVNVFARQLSQPQFCDEIQRLLEAYALEPPHLMLELTEDRFILDDEIIRRSLKCLHKMGVMIAAEFFSTGYSSPDQLLRSGVDVIKVNRELVKTLENDKRNRDLVNSIVHQCHQNKKRVCMEGIETREEQRTIFLFNIDCIQGSFISQFVSREEFGRNFVDKNLASEESGQAVEFDNQRKQLEDNNDLLMLLMDAMPLCLNVWNRNVEILACNQEALRLFGVREYQEFKDKFYSFSPEYQPDGESSAQKARRMVFQAFEKGKESFFWMHCLSDGTEIPTDVSFVKIPYQQDYVVVSYTRDMRGQFKAEESARKYNSRLQSILNATPLCLNLWNRDFENTMCNKAALELFDLKSETEYTRGFSGLSPEVQPDGSISSEAAVAKIQEAFNTGGCQFRWQHCKPDGEPIPAEITLVRIEGLDDDGNDLVAGFTRDLRPQLLVEQTERNAAQRIKAVLDAMPLTCILWDMEGHAFDCNQAAVTMFGADDKNDVINHFDQFLPETQPDGTLSLERKMEKLKAVVALGAYAFEWIYQDRAGHKIPCVVSMVVLHTDEGDVIVAYSQDLRELRETLEVNKRLQQMAYFDWLTGSLSRARFMEDCRGCFQSLFKGEEFALLIFDFDNFKGLNDTYGHEFGDTVLRRVVKKITSLLPSKALLGRYGGDEFLIQIRGMDRDQLEAWMQKALSAVRDIRFLRDEKAVATSISIGAAFWDRKSTDLEMLINQADQALYEAKRSGRNGSVIL